MAKLRVAINGFGRIGRLVLRAALVSGRNDIEFVAVNDLAPAEQNAYLLEYDSVHGKLPMPVKLDGEYIIVGKQKIKCTEVIALRHIGSESAFHRPEISP